MTAIEASTVPVAQSGLVVKMEDRKRPASHDPNERTPPLKKQATSALNGSGKPHPDTDMPWKDDLERIQKDAVFRQMQEYKREKATLESQVKELTKAAAYHDDHLRSIDAWFKQLVDEVKVAFSNLDELGQDKPSFSELLTFADNEVFEKHLKERSEQIKSTISLLTSRSPKAPPDAAELQKQLAKKLAEEKTTIAELERALADKQQLEERLEAASLRYMVAEKKLDRARSVTMAKMEKQEILGPQRSSGDTSVKREDSSPANGSADAVEKIAELEAANNKTTAVSEKQKEQLEKLEAENSKLQAQITELTVKNSKLTDEDYSQTDLFKQLKSQHEDVIKRINHLEATNTQLQEEAEKLQSERTSYKVEIENEAQLAVDEKEAQLSKLEADLARVRNLRDELQTELHMRKTSQEQDISSVDQMKGLLEARENRIAALESEVERIKLSTDGVKEIKQSTAELPPDELRSKFETLEKQYEMLNTELSSMQAAFKRTSKLASQKIAELTASEEKVQRAMAEKSKADQKYFAAMKSKEARDIEIRNLRIQNMKSSDIVAQLKDAESLARSLISNVEKQLAETKSTFANTMAQYRAAQQLATESDITCQGLRLQVADLKTELASRDASLASANRNCRKAESEVEGLKATLADTKKSLESWRSRGLGNNSNEYEMLRSFALCNVCRRNFINTVLKTCGHVFCNQCIEERQQSRMRKCPNCAKSFGNNDYMHITL